MRELVSRLHAERQHMIASTAGTQTFVNEPPGPCFACGGPMVVQKTVRRCGVTLEHGSFTVVETVHACREACRTPSGERVTRRAQTLAERVPPGSVVGYDVMVRVGLERFVAHRQREEIRADLRTENGISLSSGEVSVLGRRFLAYLEALHMARAGELRAVLEADGGWPLHIDATGENGRGTMLIAYAGWRGWALGAWKIPTERTDAILPRLRALVADFGPPCAIMRDLGRAMTEAAQTLADELGGKIPVLGCHLHFVKDVGKDLLDEAHDRLRVLFRTSNIKKHLRALARDLGRRLGTRIDAARVGLERWQQDAGPHVLPAGDDGLATVRALAQWVLDFAADGTGEGFPFDRPYHNLYRRCRTACRAVDAFLRTPPDDAGVRKTLTHLRQVLRPVESEVPFEQTARRLEARAQVFDELRDALRPGVNSGRRPKGHASPVLEDDALAELRNIEAAVDTLTVSLKQRRPERGPAQDMRQAIDIILKHIERHGKSLFGHAITLPDGHVRLVDRTNNELEGFHHGIKHGERRRSGRKVLTQDFESLPAAAALAANLNRSDYVEVLCGSLDRLPAAFAQLDAATRRQASIAQTSPPQDGVDADDIEAASLPSADRRLVRTDAMGRRVRTAAASRAPRPVSATGV